MSRSLQLSSKVENPLQRFPRSKSVTSWQLPRLRGNYREKCVMDFRHDGFWAKATRLSSSSTHHTLPSMSNAPITLFNLLHFRLTGWQYWQVTKRRFSLGQSREAKYYKPRAGKSQLSLHRCSWTQYLTYHSLLNLITSGDPLCNMWKLIGFAGCLVLLSFTGKQFCT